MKISKKHVSVFIIVFIGIGLYIAHNVAVSNETESNRGELYLPSDNAMAAVHDVLARAKTNSKLALIVMGANWCHDSRALAGRLQEDPLKTLVNENYETLFVDVGFLDKGENVISSFGVPVYYATPTVLIIDPLSGQLVNADNRHQWADAFNISMDESVDYFRQVSATDLDKLRRSTQSSTKSPENLQTLLAEIDTWEQQQADRLYQAYALLSPMLKAYKDGDEDGFSEETWGEVRDFRYKVPRDREALRAEAHKRVAAGEQHIELEYPVYPPFSWQSGE